MNGSGETAVPEAGVPAYKIRGIRYRHPGDRDPFRLELDALDIPAGGILALVGPNGAGKTTLLLLLALLRRPDAGRLEFFGADPFQGAGDILRARRDVTFVTHHPYLFKGSVFDNVAFGLRARRIAEGRRPGLVAEALAMVGLDAGDRPVAALSAGQAQRVALARALVLRPRVLLLDEPTANLDAAVAPRMEAVVREASRAAGTTVVFSTHNYSQASRLADRIVFLTGGRRIGFGHENYFSGRAATDGERSWIEPRPGLRIVFSGRYDGHVTCVIRPDRVAISRLDATGSEAALSGASGPAVPPSSAAASPSPAPFRRNVFRGRVSRLELTEAGLALVRVAGELPFRANLPVSELARRGVSLSTPVLVEFEADDVEVVRS